VYGERLHTQPLSGQSEDLVHVREQKPLVCPALSLNVTHLSVLQSDFWAQSSPNAFVPPPGWPGPSLVELDELDELDEEPLDVWDEPDRVLDVPPPFEEVPPSELQPATARVDATRANDKYAK
jgi:hypothetical protein